MGGSEDSGMSGLADMTFGSVSCWALLAIKDRALSDRLPG